MPTITQKALGLYTNHLTHGRSLANNQLCREIIDSLINRDDGLSLAVHQLIGLSFNYGRPLSGCSKKLWGEPNRHESQLWLKREHLLPLKSRPQAC